MQYTLPHLQAPLLLFIIQVYFLSYREIAIVFVDVGSLCDRISLARLVSLGCNDDKIIALFSSAICVVSLLFCVSFLFLCSNAGASVYCSHVCLIFILVLPRPP